MAEHSSLMSQNWTDILPPVAPASMTPLWLLTAVVLLLLVLIVVFVLRRQSPRQRARRAIRLCRRHLRQAGIDTRQLAVRVYVSLLEGLRLSPATAQRHPAADWQRFYLALQQCAFGPVAPSSAELATLITEAQHWLQRYPR